MNTLRNCIAKDIKNQDGNDLKRLIECEALKVDRLVKSYGFDIMSTEYNYTFEDGSDLRVTQCDKRRLKFVASGGNK